VWKEEQARRARVVAEERARIAAARQEEGAEGIVPGWKWNADGALATKQRIITANDGLINKRDSVQLSYFLQALLDNGHYVQQLYIQGAELRVFKMKTTAHRKNKTQRGFVLLASRSDFPGLWPKSTDRPHAGF
jgi:hypothetical protein